jgi:hypothetical protein
MGRCLARACLVVAWLFGPWASSFAIAEEPKPDGRQVGATEPAEQRSAFMADVCRRIEMAAGMWSLPPAFLARLIWQESRFDPGAVSPAGAQGIAQFMPGTARLRQLDDPFDLRTAIPASAHFLFDLRNQFGSLGLAAAAYNAGPGRVQRWRSGLSGLPRETWHYVLTITGLSPDSWANNPRPAPISPCTRTSPFGRPASACPFGPSARNRNLTVRPGSHGAHILLRTGHRQRRCHAMRRCRGDTPMC